MSLQRLRRGLVRPLNAAALEALREGDLPDAMDIELHRIDEGDFQRHFQIFNDLERVCGINCDDFGVEEIEIERLPGVIRLLRACPAAGDQELGDLLDRMWGLCHRAELAGMPVFLVL
jgi:hypothetical protein